jgi:16S rRNA (guanine527-N7)-methyltransferase
MRADGRQQVKRSRSGSIPPPKGEGGRAKRGRVGVAERIVDERHHAKSAPPTPPPPAAILPQPKSDVSDLGHVRVPNSGKCEFGRGRDVAAADLAADRAKALELTPVSRETEERLDRFVALLLAWQRTTNLIASSTVARLWTRHIADSLQLLDLAPEARVWIDVGSGGGFPGLVIACALADKAGASVHLVESNAKKAAFLRAAQRATESPAKVHAERMEAFAQHFRGGADALTARAVAPLKPLFEITFPLLGTTGAVALFPKGQNAELELSEASKSWKMRATLVVSRTEPTSRIIVIRKLERRAAAP